MPIRDENGEWQFTEVETVIRNEVYKDYPYGWLKQAMLPYPEAEAEARAWLKKRLEAAGLPFGWAKIKHLPLEEARRWREMPEFADEIERVWK